MAAGLKDMPERALSAQLQATFSASKADPVRLAAFERFQKTGLPHRRVEGWRWSDLNAALRDFVPANDGVSPIPPSKFSALDPVEIQIVNGRIIRPTGTLPAGLCLDVTPASATMPDLEGNSVVSLTVAMITEALEIRVDAGVKLGQPILVRHIMQCGTMAFVQVAAHLGDGAEATIIETYDDIGAGQGGFYSSLFHSDICAGATLKRRMLQNTNADAVVHAMFAANLAGGAHLNQAGLSTGGRLSRHETLAQYVGSDASAELSSAALVDASRHADFTSKILHAASGCQTRQIHKGVARDKGRAVFQGKFDVQRVAQQTDAQMSADALLLSDTSEAYHKPELEIYADDVQCAHGSTSGALDDDAMFYLRQRGLNEEMARSLLIEAFLGEVIDNLEEGEAPVFRDAIALWLKGQGA